jgi:predicted site-specific integrase-resolvase
MEEFCRGRGLAVDEWIEEIGGGLNFKRKKFLKLMRQIRLGEVNILVVAHKDRLARFAYDFLEEFASWYGCEMVVANQESLSPQAEMVEDLMSIVHTFSCRLYGLRNYKRQIKKVASISLDSTDLTK